MKENLLDVLLYLFEHFFYDEPDAVRDRDSLQSSLIEAGFSPADVARAFDWLDGLARQRPRTAGPQAASPALRMFAAPEVERLDTDARGFLLFLEQHGILDPDQRELVIDRAMALEQAEVDVDDLKWVVLMVLFNQPGSEEAFAWMESQLLDEAADTLH